MAVIDDACDSTRRDAEFVRSTSVVCPFWAFVKRFLKNDISEISLFFSILAQPIVFSVNLQDSESAEAELEIAQTTMDIMSFGWRVLVLETGLPMDLKST